MALTLGSKHCALHMRALFRKCRRVREISKEKIMKTVFATLILAIAIASPALAQRAQSAPQQGYQQNGYYNGYPLSEWYRTDRIAKGRTSRPPLRDVAPPIRDCHNCRPQRRASDRSRAL